MNFYRLFDDINYPGRWYLGDINVEDNWIFSNGIPINENEFTNLSIEIDKKGTEMDFCTTDAFDIPIISRSFAECLYECMNEVQLIPILIPNSVDIYYILVINSVIDCVDEAKSDFKKFENDNNIRPDLAGE
mgnify:CR=1 FL=1